MSISAVGYIYNITNTECASVVKYIVYTLTDCIARVVKLWTTSLPATNHSGAYVNISDGNLITIFIDISVQLPTKWLKSSGQLYDNNEISKLRTSSYKGK